MPVVDIFITAVQSARVASLRAVSFANGRGNCGGDLVRHLITEADVVNI